MGGFVIAGCIISWGNLCGGLTSDGHWYVAPTPVPQAQYRCMAGDPRCEVLPPLGWRLEPLRPLYPPPEYVPPRQPAPIYVPPRLPPQPRAERPLPPKAELRREPPPAAAPDEQLDGGPVVPLTPSPPSHPPRPYIQR